MKTVVTGGLGLIGTHLIKHLLDEGRKNIVVVDRYKDQFDGLVNLGIKPSDFEYRQANLGNYQETQASIKDAGSVFHLAARVGGLEYLHGKRMTEFMVFQNNMAIDANVFRACYECGVKKLVYASSCAVYPLAKQYSQGAVFAESDLNISRNDFRSIQKLDALVTDPDGGYGWEKLIAELELNWLENVDVGIARIFNAYGINEPVSEKAHVVGDFISRAIQNPGGDFLVYGNGEQSRDFVYVSDCAEALYRLEDKASNPPVTLNVGSGTSTTIQLLAEKVVEISGKKFNLLFDTKKPIGPVSRMAETSKVTTILKWVPKIDIDDGLIRTYRWIENRLKKIGGLERHP